MLTRCFTFIAMRFAIRCVLGFSEAMFFYCALCVMGACFDVNQYSLVTWAAHFNGRRFQDHIVWNTYCNGDWWQISIATKWQQSVCLGGGGGGGGCGACVCVCVCGVGWVGAEGGGGGQNSRVTTIAITNPWYIANHVTMRLHVRVILHNNVYG